LLESRVCEMDWHSSEKARNGRFVEIQSLQKNLTSKKKIEKRNIQPGLWARLKPGDDLRKTSEMLIPNGESSTEQKKGIVGAKAT